MKRDKALTREFFKIMEAKDLDELRKFMKSLPANCVIGNGTDCDNTDFFRDPHDQFFDPIEFKPGHYIEWKGWLHDYVFVKEEKVEDSPTWPTVLEFAERMERKLAQNRHKGDREGWLKDDLSSLIARLHDEYTELIVALDEGLPAERIADEAADIANFAMMVADHALTNGERPE